MSVLAVPRSIARSFERTGRSASRRSKRAALHEGDAAGSRSAGASGERVDHPDESSAPRSNDLRKGRGRRGGGQASTTASDGVDPPTHTRSAGANFADEREKGGSHVSGAARLASERRAASADCSAERAQPLLILPSLCGKCFRHTGQNFLISNFSDIVRLFLGRRVVRAAAVATRHLDQIAHNSEPSAFFTPLRRRNLQRRPSKNQPIAPCGRKKAADQRASTWGTIRPPARRGRIAAQSSGSTSQRPL